MKIRRKVADWWRLASGRDARQRLISLTTMLEKFSSASADLRKVADQEASWDSARYMADSMLSTARSFTDLKDFLTFCVAEAGAQPVYLEFGVFSGRSINMIAHAAGPEARIVGFDSFEGLPERWRDGYEAGTFQVDGLPKVRRNVELVKGWFDQTLPEFVKTLRIKVGFIHIDCDLYSSTRTILENLAPHLADDVMIVFDEYFNYPGWRQHEFKAFQEFIRDSDYSYRYVAYVPVHQQVAVKLSKKLS